MRTNVKNALEALKAEIDSAFENVRAKLEDLSRSDLLAVIHHIEQGYINKPLCSWIKDIADENWSEEDLQDEKDAILEDSWRNEND